VIFLSPEFLGFALASILFAQSRERGLGPASVAAAFDLAFMLIFLGAAQSAILVGFTLLGFAVLALQGRRGALALGVATMLAVFIVAKQYAFLPAWLRPESLPIAVGLSYVLFRQLHLIVDRAQGAEARPGLAMHLHYSLNAHAIVSGPFQRFEEHEELLRAAPRPEVLPAMARLANGYLKVAVISPLLLGLHARLVPALAIRDWPAWLGTVSGLEHALAAALAWLVYTYFNFAGYTDIVVAWARLCRLDLPENFDRPIAATGFLDFWSRWHMTMTGWFKTYVFSPLMMAFARRLDGRRGAVIAAALAFFFTFLLVGAWHGPAKPFIVCGVLLGAGATVNQVARELLRKRRTPPAPIGALLGALGSALTFLYIAVAVSPFWLEQREYGDLLRAIARPHSVTAIALVVVATTLVVVVLRWLDGAFRSAAGALGERSHAPLAIALRLIVLVPAVLATSDALPHFVYQGI
jgi:D-alanyl-lipoteichoic acid acyltransferase DltB (MBOAT superfamily)